MRVATTRGTSFPEPLCSPFALAGKLEVLERAYLAPIYLCTSGKILFGVDVKVPQ